MLSFPTRQNLIDIIQAGLNGVMKLINEQKIGRVTCLPTDAIIPKHNFRKKHKTVTPGQEQWKGGAPVNATRRLKDETG